MSNRRPPIDRDGDVTILHATTLAPWGHRRLEHGKEVGGHGICVFKIIHGNVVAYYMVEIEQDLIKTLRKDREALRQFVRDPVNLRMATHLDTVKVATCKPKGEHHE